MKVDQRAQRVKEDCDIAGTVSAMITERGFGFISSPGLRDIFFHMSDLSGLEFDEQLRERRVVFDILDTDRGPKAVNIRPAK